MIEKFHIDGGVNDYKLDTTMKYIAIDDNVIKNDYQKYG